MKITKALLAEKDACAEQIKLFAREWPNGGEVTVENVRRALELEIDIAWAVENMLSAPAQKAYFDAIAPAQKAYFDAIAPAQKAYFDAIAAAQKAYDDAIAPAQKAYFDAIAAARKAYFDAIAPARKAYFDAIAPAFVAAWLVDYPEVTK